MRFYEDFRKSKEWQVREFYEDYSPQIVEGEYTCVGLGLELMRRLGVTGRGLCLVSCEEALESCPQHCSASLPSPLAEKEHVLCAARVCIDGREGVILLDPGYHVARAVTVMRDSQYPHTGWFTQTNETWVKREYRYFFPEHMKDYVVWEVKETRGASVKYLQNLIYVGHPFENGIDFTEKRNLVYNYRSWLVRNFKGEIIAGLYFALEGSGPASALTLLCSDTNANKQRLKLSFNDFLQGKDFTSEESYVIETCGQQLGMGSEFKNILFSLAEILADTDFISQVLDINEEINKMSP